MSDKSSWKYWQIQTDNKGRQTWHFNAKGDDIQAIISSFEKDFIFDKSANPNSADLLYRGHKTADYKPKESGYESRIESAAFKAVSFYRQLQAESGHWPADYGGPHFLAPDLIIASYITNSPLPEAHQVLIRHYFLNHQNADGGWGLHLESPSTMFGTVLHYVSLRILGLPATDDSIVRARKWIHANGGACGVPSWGKFYLSVLGVYEWQGCNSLFPEMWIMPEWLPVHPSRYWCHARMVYLPMAYCYGLKVTGAITPLVKELRKELYTTPYEQIDWKEARNKCAEPDLYWPQKPLLKFLNFFTNTYEKIHINYFRKKAIDFCLNYINVEDEHTNYIDIGPVNQVINSIAVWHAYGKDSEQFKKHYERWFDYLWVAEDGMKMNGYNGSQLWDTAFAMQAITEGNVHRDFPEVVQKAYNFIKTSRVTEEVREHKKYFRHDSYGGWPFSTVDHGWPITDCTAEGLKCTLLARELGLGGNELQNGPGLEVTADLLLSFQNEDGGWASYELIRGPEWLEKLNPSEIFGNIMIEHSYTECSSAAIQALLKFAEHYPNYRKADIQHSVERGIEFILGQQHKNGGWYGSWAVCFTYGTWFAIEALTHYLAIEDSARVKVAIHNACEFLVSHQNPDGGWGEKFDSCLKKQYIASEKSQVVNTAWALLSLIAADYPNRKVIDKGIEFLLSRQETSGDFPQENISGVFNHSCGISYTSYRNVFPIWALNRYCKKYLSSIRLAD
ncbi:MAG: terpene cyclase/mutase family protein [Chitinophagales bacterium]